MSLLIAIVGQDSQADSVADLTDRALACARKQNFGTPRHLAWPGGQVLWFDAPGNPGRAGHCLSIGDRFMAYTGSLHWQGKTGEPLLQTLMGRFDSPQQMPLRDFAGAFAMVIGHGSSVWLFGDAVGIQKLYGSLDGKVLSTSWLLCRQMLQQPKLNRLRAQEYVLLGSTHGLQTPIDGVRTLDPTRALDLGTGKSVTLHAPQTWRIDRNFKSPDEAAEDLSSMLANDFKGMVQAFGDKIGMALSGGFDSRLILAALDSQGARPQLYVYGKPQDDDVRVARGKAAELGVPIDCIDKQQANGALAPLDRGRLKANIAFFDGLPVDGVFDRGLDQATRLQQVRDGTLNLNGGGGEILRNFFYLPDRAYCARDLVAAFYCNWLPAAIPVAAEREALNDATADGILDCLGLPKGSDAARRRALTRRDVELVYALFRLRFWMGRNNSVAARNGAFMTPLVSPRLVEQAAAVPLAWKTYGSLEASIINRLSPRVASGDSNYGFSFSNGPTPAYHRYINATLYRPIIVRRWSARIRRALGRNPTAIVPREWQQTWPLQPVDWIDPAFLTDVAQVNRLMTLQALLDDGLCQAC